MGSGCSFREPYPDEWAGLGEIAEGCPDIAGTYDNRGQLFNKAGEHSWHSCLSGYLGLSQVNPTATRVEISQPDSDRIEITAWENENRLMQKNYSRETGDFKCEAGFVEFDRPEGWFAESEILGLGYEWGDFRFRRSTDGALIMEITSSGFGTVYLLPVAVTQGSWYRFEPIEGEPISK
jgi:hypothetical protein